VKRPHLVLALIWLMMFVAYFDRINITVAGPAIASSLGLAPASFGSVLAAFTFGYALMQIPGGYLADRFGSRPLLILALVFWSIFTGLTGFATSFAMLVVVRILFGIGEGLENGAQFKLIGDHFPSRERSAANAVFLTALSLGPAVAAPISGWLVARAGWQALFFWFTIPGLLVAALLAVFLPRAGRAAEAAQAGPPVHAHAGGGDWRATLGTGTSWLAFCAYLGFNVAFWGFIGWMPSYLNATRHIALDHLGSIAAVPYVCGFAGTVVVGWLGTTLFARHRPALVAVSYLCAGASLYVAFSAQGVEQSIAGLSFAAFFLYGGFGPFWAIALDLIHAGMRGAFTGFVNFGGQIGGFFAPIVVGAIVGATKSFLVWLEFAVRPPAPRVVPDDTQLRPA
jgi:sugar phosphate permease